MIILARTGFKHGRAAFQTGRFYDVPDVVAGYFVGVGWAEGADGTAADVIFVPLEQLGADAPAPAKVAADGAVLEVRSGTLGQSAGEG